MRLLSLGLVLLMFSASFAGGYIPNSDPDKYPVPQVIGEPPEKIVEIRTIEKLVERPQPEPSCGWAIGSHGIFPTISYSAKNWDIEVGYTNQNGDQSAVIKAGGTISQSGWTAFKVGMSLFPGNGPLLGLYGALEQYLTPSVSISGFLYPVLFGNSQNITGQAILGGRWYF